FCHLTLCVQDIARTKFRIKFRLTDTIFSYPLHPYPITSASHRAPACPVETLFLFSQVAVAIKVNKSNPEILQQAKLEIFILEQLRRLDPDAANIVKWNGFFLDRERVCLKFELLDQCLWDYIGDPNNRCLPISEVRPILGQLTNALSHLGSLGIVHADLKPGNIMVVNRYESPVKVRLIDFGLACPASAVMPGDRVGTVGYSAPEVMLGLPYNEACDMWSLGLVAVELGTGLDYRDEVNRLTEWCSVNNLQLNTTKTKELILDFRKGRADPAPLYIHGSCVERVHSMRFLGVQISDDLSWTANTTAVVKRPSSVSTF
uniref:Protein kinase domain-containing protein n=1 Tax=Maylandia zebra TaxID=106582 RepID=A0A3P9BJA6_9CICH